MRSEPLFVDEFVCVMRKGHPLTTGRWTVKRFAEQDHVLVAPHTRSILGAVDALLGEQGLSRRITRVVTTFSLALPLIADSERIAVLPLSFANAHARSAGLAIRPLPVTLPLRAQLQTSAGSCFDATYGTATKNDATQFAAKN